MAEMNGVFAINKPTNISSAQFLSRVQHIFTNSINFSQELSKLQGEKIQQIQKDGQKASRRKLRKVLKVKMGHGGTLDPLATGVLVIGIGKGTKLLQNYLSGSVKTYETEALFGGSTTTGDVEGELLTRTSTLGITQKLIDEIPCKFKGDLRQTPPIFAALKMNGKPLYEYAREGIPLPKAIKPRDVVIHELEVFKDTLSRDHDYKILQFPKEVEELQDNLFKNPTLNDDKLYYSKQYCESHNLPIDEEITIAKPSPIQESENQEDFKAPLLHFKAKVSSGTYIRSLISDIGKSCGSSAYMVKLIRCQQAEWELGKNVFELKDFEERDDLVWGKVLKQVFDLGGDKVNDLKALFDRAEKEVEEMKKKQLELEKSVEEQIKNEATEQSSDNKNFEVAPEVVERNESVSDKKRKLECEESA